MQEAEEEAPVGDGDLFRAGVLHDGPDDDRSGDDNIGPRGRKSGNFFPLLEGNGLKQLEYFFNLSSGKCLAVDLFSPVDGKFQMNRRQCGESAAESDEGKILKWIGPFFS